MRLSLLILLPLLATAAGAQAPRLIVARGAWASFDRGPVCEALALSLPVRGQARASVAIAFDRQGPRNGQLAARLRRPVRPGSTALLVVGREPFQLVARGAHAWSSGPAQEAAIIAAMRAAGGMRIQARDAGGRSMTDRFLLDGAPTAIDAAAAACSFKR